MSWFEWRRRNAEKGATNESRVERTRLLAKEVLSSQLQNERHHENCQQLIALATQNLQAQVAVAAPANAPNAPVQIP